MKSGLSQSTGPPFNCYFPVNWSPFQLFLGLILILRHIDANLLWEEAISITFLMVDKPNMAQMIARYDDDSGDDDITAKSNSRAIETKEKNLPFDGEKLGIVETLVSLMSPSFNHICHKCHGDFTS